MTDQETIAAYDRNVNDYKNCFAGAEQSKSLKLFEETLPRGAAVLDLGCGPANASAHLRDKGHHPDPVDASPEMVKLANETYDIGAREATFHDISGEQVYDGVWANFSLLHADRDDMSIHLNAINKALKEKGILHLGMKLGSSSKRDRLDRLYTYYEEAELAELLEKAGFSIVASETFSERGLAGTIDPCIVILARKN